MKSAFLVLVLLFLGCLQQTPAVLTPNETTPATPSDNNVTPPVAPVNITNESAADGSVLEAVAGGNITAQNITIPAVNETSANETANESVPSGPAPPSGIAFANGSYLLVLDDVSVSGPSGSCGIFSILHAENYSLVTRLLVCPGDSQTWLSPEGNMYRIFVIQVAAGYTHEEKWARVIIFG